MTDSDSAFHAWFAALDVVAPSVSAALFDRTGILAFATRGEFARDGRRATPNTVHRIASMSKSITAGVTLALADQGLLDLDEPVATSVPEFPDHVDAAGVRSRVTVRMLLTNSSGLPEDNAWADRSLDLSREQLRALLRRGLAYGHAPGTEYQYSNLAFAVLGVVIEHATRRPFTEVAIETLLDPLHLTSTRFRYDEIADRAREHDGTALGYDTFDGGDSWLQRPFLGSGAFDAAGSAFSTLADIARWSAWLSSPFEAGASDDSVLSRTSRRLMQRIHTPIPSVEPRHTVPTDDNIGYGMGLIVEQDRRFGGFAQHSGGLPGFSTTMRWHLDSGLGVAIFATTSGVAPAAWARELLTGMLTDRGAPARHVTVSRETMQAAARVDELVRQGRSLRSAPELFSANVFSDIPGDLRDRGIARAIAAAGGVSTTSRPLQDRLVSAVSAAQLTWRIPGTTGEIECSIETTPVYPVQVQRLTVATGAPARESVGRHYRAVPPAPDAAISTAARSNRNIDGLP